MLRHAGNVSDIKNRLCYHQTLLLLFHTLKLAHSHCSSCVQYGCSGLVECSWCKGEGSLDEVASCPLPWSCTKSQNRYIWICIQTPVETCVGCLEKVWGKEDKLRTKPHSVHSLVSSNAWLGINSGEWNCFSVVILEVTHVFAVSRTGVSRFCCSLWLHTFSHQEITLWCCCLSTRDVLLSVKQTSKSWQGADCSLLFGSILKYLLN